MQISAVIITKNEERNIERCLQSLQGFADEIVVVDSFSTDATKEICEKYTNIPLVKIRFIEHIFEGHIEQKNYAMQQAIFPFVLSLDADEVLSEPLRQSIQKIKNSDLPESYYADAYKFNRLNNYCGKWIRHGGWYPDTKIRLWKKNKGCWGGTNPHDMVVMQANTKIVYLKGDLLHYTYNSISEHIQQMEKFSTIAAEHAKKNGKKVSLPLILLKTKWKFIRDYIFKCGFLDGYYGYVICKINAMTTFLKYVKLRELYRFPPLINSGKKVTLF